MSTGCVISQPLAKRDHQNLHKVLILSACCKVAKKNYEYSFKNSASLHMHVCLIHLPHCTCTLSQRWSPVAIKPLHCSSDLPWQCTNTISHHIHTDSCVWSIFVVCGMEFDSKSSSWTHKGKQHPLIVTRMLVRVFKYNWVDNVQFKLLLSIYRNGRSRYELRVLHRL